jgi:hypothetical protein
LRAVRLTLSSQPVDRIYGANLNVILSSSVVLQEPNLS